MSCCYVELEKGGAAQARAVLTSSVNIDKGRVFRLLLCSSSVVMCLNVDMPLLRLNRDCCEMSRMNHDGDFATRVS